MLPADQLQPQAPHPAPAQRQGARAAAPGAAAPASTATPTSATTVLAACHRAHPALVLCSLLIDTVVALGPATIGLVLAGPALVRMVLVMAAPFLAVTLLYTHCLRGRGVGGALLRLRTVDSEAGLPPGSPRALLAVLRLGSGAGATVVSTRRGPDPSTGTLAQLRAAVPPPPPPPPPPPSQPSQPSQPAAPLPPSVPPAPAPAVPEAAPSYVSRTQPPAPISPVSQPPSSPTAHRDTVPAAPNVPAVPAVPAIDVSAPGGWHARITSAAVLGSAPGSRHARGAPQALTVPNPGGSVSKEHARISLEEAGVTVTDMRSAYGTVVLTAQGQRAVCPSGQPVLLAPPCRLELGALQLVVTSPAPA